MDRLNLVMVRASFIWLLAGVTIGAVMLVDRAIPGSWQLWLLPSHVHMLVVGWFLQFALGIAYWLLPRKRSAERPLGYNERLAFAAVAGLNVGLVLRVIAETAERSGHKNTITLTMLSLSAIFQVAGIAVFVYQLWSRVQMRPRANPSQRLPSSKEEVKV